MLRPKLPTLAILNIPMFIVLAPMHVHAFQSLDTAVVNGGLVANGRSIKTTFLEPMEVTVVAAAEPGIVSEVLVKEGARVEKGQILGVLDMRVHSEMLKAAKVRAQSSAKLDAASSALELQELRRRNFEKLAGEGHANKAEMDKIHLEFATAQAAFEIASNEMLLSQMDVDRIQVQIELRKITSPLNGIVTSVHRNAGEFLPANDPKFATVVRLDRLKAKFFLNSSELDAFVVGEPVTIYLVQSDREVSAKVSFVSPIVDPDSGTARIEVAVENSKMLLKSGLVCFLGSRRDHNSMHNTLRMQFSDRSISRTEGVK